MRKGLNFKDIDIVPKPITVNSRDECNISASLGDLTFNLPVFPANMHSVICNGTVKFLTQNNLFYIMHRFSDSVLQFARFTYEKNIPYTSVSIGINNDSYKQLEEYLISKYDKSELDYICIDVAQADQPKTKKMLSFLKENFPDSFILCGTVATRESVVKLDEWGADAAVVGISGGSACTTKDRTGFHVPPVTLLMDIDGCTKKPIIYTGGAKKSSDIIKCLSLGAKFCMCGYMFAGYDESPIGDYYGNASAFIPGKSRHIEGTKIEIQPRGSMEMLLDTLRDDLTSAVSYSGGTNLSSLRNVEMLEVK